jgi:PKD repeat protein
MGGKSFTHSKNLLIFGAILVAFFVLSNEAKAFGHPDVTALAVEFASPNAGAPLKPGFTVEYKISDTTTNDIGGEPLFVALYTKNGREDWVGRGGAETFTKTFINKDWCNAEGTNTCGVRIRAADNAGHIMQAERFFTIDTTPPKITVNSNRSDPTQKTDVEFRYSAFDEYGIARVECGLDGLLQPCISSRSYLNISPDGRHKFRVRASDKVGNSAEKTLEWTIDSTPPTIISGLSITGPTYFSEELNWISPEEFSIALGKIIPALRYDIRYSREPITEKNWNETTAIVHNEPIPKEPGNPESMRAGPENDGGVDFRYLRLGDISNILSANIKHYFAIKSRDDNWNWSKIQPSAPSLWTDRDPCDYDADRLYSPKSPSAGSGQGGCGPKVCNPSIESCDLYDNPYEWRLPGDWPYDKRDEEWIRAFGATANDLDQDGEGVAAERIGVNQATKKEITGYQKQAGSDWYDNPFTLDFFGLSLRPTLKQLSDTINDLDLDTFVSQEWKEKFGTTEEKPETVLEAELKILSQKNISGLIYPGARESTCFDCTSYSPDQATGRIPPGKTQATTNKNRAVGQIEAYYSDLPIGQYEVIKQGTIDKKRPTIAASAQCRDGLNNDLESGIDSSDDPRDPNREINCPTKFTAPSQTRGEPRPDPLSQGGRSSLTAAIFPDVGLVQCGRHADDYRTPIDESANCNICHLFYLLFNLINILTSRLMPFLVAVSFVAGGFLMVIARGAPERFAQGKKIMLWSVSAYAIILLVWTLLSIFFALIGTTKWTGLTPERGEVSALSQTEITDISKNWGKDRWRGYVVEIQPKDQKEESVMIKIASNSKNSLTLAESQPVVPSADKYKYHILNTGWWSFTCGLGETIIADFSASPDSGIAPFSVDFTDLSLGEKITSWQWDFGDGGTSADQSPAHTYTTNGPHTVTLTVRTQDGASGKKTKTIHYAPTADFSADKAHGRLPHKVQFKDKSTGEIERWSWDFDGDNREDSSEKNPQHTYTLPGPYRVKLTVLGPGGRDSESKVSHIFVYPKPIGPIAEFSASTIPGTLTAVTSNSSFAAFLTRFDSDFSPLNPNDHFTGWKWDFGDGWGTSAVENPTYFYGTSIAPYTITLTALGPGGENSASTTVAFPPGANFSADKTSGVLPASGPFSVRFTDHSTGTVSGWEWSFGDGGADNAQNPTHNYQANGAFDVILKATGPEGENAKIISDYIKVAPRAEFSYSAVALTDLTPQKPNDCLISSGCTVGVSGASVTFSNNSLCPSARCSSYWEFGDGASLETGMGPITHKYTNNEVYTVRLTVTGPGGSNTAEKQAYINVSPFSEFAVKTAPGGEVSGDGVTFSGNESGTVNFSNSSRVSIPANGWLWEFGDQKTSSEKEASHIYSSINGCYSPKLTATGPGGLDAEVKENYVKFTPIAKIEPSTIPSHHETVTVGCGETAPPPRFTQTFQNVSQPTASRSGGNWTVSWSNGSASPGSTTMDFTGEGTHTASLTVANSCGDESTASVSVTLSQSVIIDPPCPPPPPEEPEPEPKPSPDLNVWQEWINNIVDFLVDKAGFSVQEAINFIDPFIPDF